MDWMETGLGDLLTTTSLNAILRHNLPEQIAPLEAQGWNIMETGAVESSSPWTKENTDWFIIVRGDSGFIPAQHQVPFLLRCRCYGNLWDGSMKWPSLNRAATHLDAALWRVGPEYRIWDVYWLRSDGRRIWSQSESINLFSFQTPLQI